MATLGLKRTRPIGASICARPNSSTYMQPLGRQPIKSVTCLQSSWSRCLPGTGVAKSFEIFEIVENAPADFAGHRPEAKTLPLGQRLGFFAEERCCVLT